MHDNLPHFRQNISSTYKDFDFKIRKTIILGKKCTRNLWCVNSYCMNTFHKNHVSAELICLYWKGWEGGRLGALYLYTMTSSKTFGILKSKTWLWARKPSLMWAWTSGWKCQIHSPLFLSIENSAKGKEREERTEIGYDYFKHKAAFVLQSLPSFHSQHFMDSKSSKREGTTGEKGAKLVWE